MAKKRDSGKTYTSKEIECMKKYSEENGNFHTYEEANEYAKHHEKETGMQRSGHALYMFGWRVANGKYDAK